MPKGLDPKKFGTKSVPRNLLIAGMLHRANYIEKAGTGIGRIKSALEKHKKEIDLKIDFRSKSLFYSVIFKKTGWIENPKIGLVEKPKTGLVENSENRVGRKSQKSSRKP